MSKRLGVEAARHEPVVIGIAMRSAVSVDNFATARSHMPAAITSVLRGAHRVAGLGRGETDGSRPLGKDKLLIRSWRGWIECE